MSKSVLFIDDEEWFLEPTMERLEHGGITFDYCRTGFDGLKKIETGDYKVVILDMKVSLGEELKRVVGYEYAKGIYILQQIKKTKTQLPVLCYTVLKDKEILSEIEEAGGSHITKGGEEDLVDEIKKILAKNEREKQRRKTEELLK
ncbi:MAG: response regulator [bacterium]|nr:response regulator [bacterium]